MLKKPILFVLCALFALALPLSALSACAERPTAAPSSTTAGETTTDPDLATSKGLAMSLSADGTYYIVSGIGACTDTSIRIPYRHNGIPVKEIGGGAFLQNTALKSVTLSPEIVRIGDSAFYRCTSLKSVTFAAGLNEIGENAFGGCTALTALSIPDTVTRIADYAFSGTAIATVALPITVMRVESGAFRNCHDLKTVTYPGTRAEIFQVFFAQDWCKGAPESAVAVLCTDGAQAVGVAVPRP